jgi:hypothetical protein
VDIEPAVADIQRPAFMAAQDASRKLPCDTEIFDVLRVDLIEAAVSVPLVISELHRPKLWILLQLQDGLIGEGRARERDRG